MILLIITALENTWLVSSTEYICHMWIHISYRYYFQCVCTIEKARIYSSANDIYTPCQHLDMWLIFGHRSIWSWVQLILLDFFLQKNVEIFLGNLLKIIFWTLFYQLCCFGPLCNLTLYPFLKSKERHLMNWCHTLDISFLYQASYLLIFWCRK